MTETLAGSTIGVAGCIIGSCLITFGEVVALEASEIVADFTIFLLGKVGVFVKAFGLIPRIFCSACNWAGFNTAGLELFSELMVEIEVTD